MRRIPELDSVRGLAAITIVLYHLAPARFHFGWAAVDCFFVLSSFLITMILLEYRGRPGLFRNFYARRSLRIWPIYYLGLSGLVAVNWLLRIGEPTTGLPYYLTYTQNIPLYWGHDPPQFIRAYAHTWTLALEEQYYILWPLIVCLFGRRTLVGISVALGVGAVVARLNEVPEVLLAARCDGFALGGLLALILFQRADDPEYQERWAGRLWCVLAIAGLGCVAMLLGLWKAPDPASVFVLAFFGLIGVVVLRSGERWLGLLRLPALMYVGTISYGLYLYHVPIDLGVEIVLRKMGIFHRKDVGYPVWRTLLETALAFTVAIASWHLIEKPILGLKGRFSYRPKPKTGLSSSVMEERPPAEGLLGESVSEAAENRERC